MKCCDITPGMLRHSIGIYQWAKTPDGMGGTTNAPELFSTVRAFIKPVSGGERWQSMRIEANVTHRIYMRYRAGITADKFIQYGSRKFNIKAVINLEEANQWLEVYAEEGVVV